LSISDQKDKSSLLGKFIGLIKYISRKSKSVDNNQMKNLKAAHETRFKYGEQLSVSADDIIRLICNDRNRLRGGRNVAVYIAK
jgi:hypothetical protein